MAKKKVQEKYARATNPMYETLIVILDHYRQMENGREKLIEAYNGALAREEAHIAKRREEKKKNRKVRYDNELSFTIIDDFLRKWDGKDPMSAGSLG